MRFSEIRKRKDDLNQYLVFSINCNEYSIPIVQIKRIYDWGKFKSSQGVDDIEESRVPVFDLRDERPVEFLLYENVAVVITFEIAVNDSFKVIGLVVDDGVDIFEAEVVEKMKVAVFDVEEFSNQLPFVRQEE